MFQHCCYTIQWHLGEGAVRVKVFNDKKKFNKRKKRMENGEFSSTNGVGVRGRSMIGEWRMENGEWEGARFLHSPFSNLQLVIRKLFSTTI